MTDITKCSGEACKIKEKCYRYSAKANTYQYWLDPQGCIENNYNLFYPWEVKNIDEIPETK